MVTMAAPAPGAVPQAVPFSTRLDAALAQAFWSYRLRTGVTVVRNLHRFNPRYVEFLQHMVRHAATVSEVIEEAAVTLDRTRPDVAAMFRAHGKEERGHDNVARADLRSLGAPEHGTEKPAGLALEAYVRQAAQHHPLKVLGFLTAAEGLAARVGPTVLRLLGLLGHTQQTTRFLRLHAEVDVVHFQELRHMCLTVARTPQEEDEVLEAIAVTANLLARA